MSDHVEARAKVIVEVLAPITLTPDEHRELLAVLWDWNAEDWERGVMYGGGPGTIKPELGENPYRKPPLVLPTKPCVIRAVVNGRPDVLLTGPHPADTSRGCGPVTWDEFDNHFHYPDEISSFEVLWTEDA